MWRGNQTVLFRELSRVGPDFILAGAVQPRGWGMTESSRGLHWAPGQEGVGFCGWMFSDIPLPCGYSEILKAGPTV